MISTVPEAINIVASSVVARPIAKIGRSTATLEPNHTSLGTAD
jgi:hypothetical protein